MLSHFSRVRLFVIPSTLSRQAPLSMRFSRQKYWREFSCPPPGDFPHPGIEPASPMSPALAGKFITMSTTLGNPNKEYLKEKKKKERKENTLQSIWGVKGALILSLYTQL